LILMLFKDAVSIQVLHSVE